MNDSNNKAVPPITSVDGTWLHHALIAGAHRVAARREHINKINVFPVADADTGTNLAFTLDAILSGAKRHATEIAGKFLSQVADHALDGARGNSGAIFAQYLQGFSEVTVDLKSLTPSVYAAAAMEGARSAQGAIAEPREGTMLSVIFDYASSLQKHIGEGVDDFRVLMTAGLERARESLANTPNQLEVLRQNGVVDAGGQGFVDLLEGTQDFIERGELDEGQSRTLDLEDADHEQAAGYDGDLSHRFCTECMVTGHDIDRRKLRERLNQLDSSSLVIAGTKEKVRVHIHLNNPAQAFVACESFGQVSSQKADDMRQQQHVSHDAQHKVAIVTDTGADMPEEEMERLRVNLVPLRINFGDRQFLDKVSMTPEQFYQRIATSDVVAKTSQPPPGDYRRQYEFLASHFSSVICLSVSSAMSGTWQAADSAAGRVDAERVQVFDTLNASCGHGLLAIFAAEAAQLGFNATEVLAALDYMRTRTHAFAVLGDLTHAVRGGRLAPWLKTLADWLRVTMVVGNSSDGRLVPKGVLMTSATLIPRYARWIARRLDKGISHRLMIGHCNALEDARKLRDELVGRLPMVQAVYLTDVGAAIGVHAGPGSLVVGTQEYLSPADWRARQGGEKEAG
jgi:DegV family protein with EDD domain